MAENQGRDDKDNEDLSEEASPYRLEQMRRQGKVSQSRELTGIFVLFGTFIAILASTSFLTEEVSALMKTVFSSLNKTDILFENLSRSSKVLLIALLPVALAGTISAILGSISQIGFVFSAEPLAPDISRIDPINGMRRLFSLRVFVEFLRITVKVALMGGLAFLLIRGLVGDSAKYMIMDVVSLGGALGGAGKLVFFGLLVVFAAFAGMDFWLQKREYTKQVRVTKQEAKQEQKEQEGDPMVRSRIRAIQKEMSRKRMMQAVKKADVIVTNPTHIAVAITYQRDKMLAPRVVAKGADFLAQQIKKIAADAGVPLVENVPLARGLYKSVKVGQYVPRSLYQAVAEVLAYVYRLKKK